MDWEIEKSDLQIVRRSVSIIRSLKCTGGLHGAFHTMVLVRRMWRRLHTLCYLVPKTRNLPVIRAVIRHFQTQHLSIIYQFVCVTSLEGGSSHVFQMNWLHSSVKPKQFVNVRCDLSGDWNYQE